jgi:hypothetical protein
MENTTLTQEQRAIRTGRFCASENYKLMGAKGLGKTGETYIYEKAAEMLTGQPIKEPFTAASTQWGIDLELEAQMYFEGATKLKIKASGTILLLEFNLAGTPDGLIEGQDCGFEIKCPYNSGNHLKNLLMSTPEDLEDLRPEYYWQIVSYMWLTGFSQWKFCSYDPRFKEEKRMFILNVPLNSEHLNLLKSRVAIAKEMFDSIISKLK